jgi:hypothetical protein
MVERALGEQDPPVEVAASLAAQEAVFEQLDACGDDSNFRRARAASAVIFLRRASYEDALYEALHARKDVSVATQEALSLMQ